MESAPLPAKRPASKLWRWTRRLSVLVLLVAVVLRASISIFLPDILDSVAQNRGLRIRYERLEFSVFTGSIELWKLEVHKAANSDPSQSDGNEEEPGELLTLLEFMAADVDVAALLSGDLIVRRAEIDGLDVYANRESAESGWSLASALPLQEAEPEAEVPAPANSTADDGEFEGYDLSLPLELRAVRMQHLQLHLVDGAQNPPIETRLELNVRLSDLGLAERPARLEVFAHGTHWLDALEVEGSFRSQGTDLNAQLACRVRGLQIGNLEPYLQPLGLNPVAASLDMGMLCDVRVQGVDGGNSALALEASLRDIVLSADRDECFAIDELTLSLPRIAPDAIQVSTSTLRGVRGHAKRGASGLIHVAGMELVGVPDADSTAEPASENVEVADASGYPETAEELDPQAPDTESSKQALALTVEALRLEECEFSFTDQTFVPAQSLSWKIQTAQLTDIQLVPGHAIGLEATMASPEILEELQVRGQLVVLGPDKSASVELAVRGIRPERVRPYLAAMGLQSTFENGQFGAKLHAQLTESEDGQLQADLRVTDIALEDASELFAIDELGLKGVRYDPVSGGVHMGEVLWQGTRAFIRRDAERNLHFFGLATGAPLDSHVARASVPTPSAHGNVQAQPDSTKTASPSDAQPPTEVQEQTNVDADTVLPRLTIDRIAWLDTTFQFLDESFSPARELNLADLGFELHGFDLGGEDDGGVRPPAKFKLWFKAAGLAEELALEGTLQTQPGPLDLALEATCRGRELSYEALSPWLTELGVEPTLQHGELDMAFSTRIAQTDTGFSGDLSFGDFRFAEGETTFLALDGLKLPDWSWNDSVLRNEGLAIDAPRFDARRDEDGALLALGLRILPQSPEASVNSADPNPSAAAPEPQESSAPAKGVPQATPLVMQLGTIAINKAQINWNDAAAPGGVDTSLTISAHLNDLTIGPGATPSSFELQLEVDGGIGDLSMAGELGLTPERVQFESKLRADQIRSGVFAAYLPPGLSMPLENGQLDAKFSAFFEPRLTGDGFGIGLTVNGVDYREAGSASALFALKQLKLDAPRLDPAGAHYELSEILLSGVQLDTRRAADGSMHALGFAIETSPANTQESANTDGMRTEDGQPGDTGVRVASAPIEASAETARPTSADRRVPTVLIGAFDVGMDHLRFLDETSDTSLPFDGGLRLRLPGPTTMISPEAADLPPIEFRIEGQATPIVQSIATKIVLTPFQQEPGLAVEFVASGLRGLGITEVLPELESMLDGAGLNDGKFETAFQAHLNVRRRSPVDFDLSTGFGLGVDFELLSFVPTPDAPELMALKNLNVAVKSIRPGSGAVHVERIELVEPKMHIRKSEQGFHLLGLTLMLPGSAEVEAAEAELEPTEPEAPAEPLSVDIDDSSVATAEPAELDGPAAFRLDEFLISGADLSFTDSSVEPAMHLPVTDLDMELKRFSTRTLTSAEPFRFRVALYGGDVELPERQAAGNLLGGILGSVGSLIDGEEGRTTEPRPVFDEILLRGNLSLGPHPKGWTQLRVRALELPSFAGPALESGIDIGDGLLNETAMLHFDGEGGMRVSSNTNISYLSLSEPADGPISSYLKLPAPIDTVLFVLRDEKGDQNIPLNITIDEGGLTAGAIMGAVGRTVGLIVGDAIASSPMKIVGGVLDMAGLEDEPLELNGDEILIIPFHPGDVQTPPTLAADVAPLLKLLRDDPSLYLVVTHQLSAADLACCDVLANPPAEECMGLAESLRRKRAGLLARRAEQSAAVHGAYSMGDLPAAETSRASLRQLDLELGATESALDRVYELTRPGAERGRARRARGTALEVAGRRMESVTRQLLAAPITGIGTRVDSRRPRFGVDPNLERGAIKISVHRRQ